MRKQDKEMFNGEWKFTIRKTSNYRDGHHWKGEYRIERHREENGLVSTMRVCDFFGSRPTGLIFVAVLNGFAGMKRTITNLRRSNATFREVNAETLTMYHLAASNLATEKETVAILMTEMRTRAEAYDERGARDCEALASKVRQIDERDVRINALEELVSEWRKKANAFEFRSQQAEALVGRIVIKRDRRSRP